MSYLESLSFDEAFRLLFYLFSFSTVVRYGFHFADWALENFKWFFSHSQKRR